MDDEATTDQETDLDLIADHPYKPWRLGDFCAHDVRGLPCGFSRAEHTDQGDPDGEDDQ
jgi:hypothetical protein